jgi:hypothetical protein
VNGSTKRHSDPRIHVMSAFRREAVCHWMNMIGVFWIIPTASLIVWRTSWWTASCSSDDAVWQCDIDNYELLPKGNNDGRTLIHELMPGDNILWVHLCNCSDGIKWGILWEVSPTASRTCFIQFRLKWRNTIQTWLVAMLQSLKWIFQWRKYRWSWFQSLCMVYMRHWAMQRAE